MSPRAVPKNRRLLPRRGHPKHSKDGFARKRRPPFHETSDAVRIAAGPGELPPVESGPDGEGTAPGIAFDYCANRAPQVSIHEPASCACASVPPDTARSKWTATLAATDETDLNLR